MIPNEIDCTTESVIAAGPRGSGYGPRYEVRVPTFPADCDYVRVLMLPALPTEPCMEAAYWSYDEIAEDIEALGAVMGAIRAVLEGRFEPMPARHNH